MHSRARIAVVGLALLIAAPHGAIGQTTAGDADGDKAPVAEEVDGRLLGAWAELKQSADRTVTDAAFTAAAASCRRIFRLTSLRFERGAARALPEALMVGSVVYYRTPVGLQRLDANAKTVNLFTKTETQDRGSKRVHILRGAALTVPIVFAKNERVKTAIMAEGRKLFVRCPGSQPRSD